MLDLHFWVSLLALIWAIQSTMQQMRFLRNTAMNKQIRIKIACILSDIFLLSALHYKDNGEIDINLTKSFYKRIANEILDVSPNFTKKDLDTIFPAIAYYCMHKINFWIFYDDWSRFDKEVMQKELETEWNLNYIFGLFYKRLFLPYLSRVWQL